MLVAFLHEASRAKPFARATIKVSAEGGRDQDGRDPTNSLNQNLNDEDAVSERPRHIHDSARREERLQNPRRDYDVRGGVYLSALSRSFSGRDGSIAYPNHIAPTSAMR